MNLLRTSPAAALLALASCGAAPRTPEPPPRSFEPPRPAPALPESGAASVASPADSDPAEAASPVEPEVPSTPETVEAARSLPAGWVAGQSLDFAEVLLEWHRVAPREVFLTVEKLVAARLAFAEADRLGIRLEPAEVEARVEASLEALAEEVSSNELGLSLDEFIRYELGVEPERYGAQVREGVIRQGIAERAVRAWAYETGFASARLIVVPEEERARALAAQVAAGADFGELARKHSIDESAARRGLLPFLVRQEESPLARLVFRTAPGTVGGPIPAAGHWFLVEVEEIHAPVEVGALGWPSLRAQVEASLRSHPVDESEFLHWKLAMERRYPVDLGPLLELVGAPRGPDPPGDERRP